MKYKLVEKQGNSVGIFKVSIRADSNDADYMTEVENYTKDRFENIVEELINLRDNYGGRHQLKDYPNEWDLYIPSNGYDGYCHTLEELAVEYTDESGKVWDVKF